MQIEQMTVCVVGLARTGRAVVKFAAERGARVLVSDIRGADEIDLSDVEPMIAEAELGCNSVEFIGRADVAVLSPGVPLSAPIFDEVAKSGTRVISELEFAADFITAPILAITGSVGKSTACALVGEMAGAAGLKVFVGGNFGPPAIEAVGAELDLCVLEVSSFQMEATRNIRPHVAGWLNLAGHHLKRHGTFENYAGAKLRLFSSQAPDDVAILNGDDPEIIARTVQLRSHKVLFSMLSHPVPGVFLERDRAVRLSEEGREEYALNAYRLKGRHNLQNLLCAIGCARAAGIAQEAVAIGYGGFNGLEHRLEPVGVFGGVSFVNDSKATTPFATQAAIEAVGGPVVLLVGGTDEGEDFSCVLDVARSRVKAVVAFGEAAPRLAGIFRGEFELMETDGLSSAVDKARGVARAGDTVLLSPGCPSFDEFKSFGERGRKFKELVSDA